MTRACCLQHISCEPPGVFEDVLRERGAEIVRAELDDGDRLPDWRSADLVVVMGGPMSVNDEEDHAWLLDEKAWIAEAVHAGVPFFGVCLGAQLLAASLGASVSRGEVPEVGVLPLELTAAARSDPVFSVVQPGVRVLQWHGDTFELPPGAVHLARSARYEHQAFRYGARAYAVQFHLEVTKAMFEEWSDIPAYRASLDQTIGGNGVEILTKQFIESRDEMTTVARRLFTRFCDHAVSTPGRQATSTSSR
jgi:GMP synthase (glutamine-hydrolysing)